MDKVNSFQVIAHRGFASNFPENTLESFEGAYQALHDQEKVVNIELDVWCLKTGEPVVIHSASLNSTTDKTGFVFNTSLEEIKGANAAIHFRDLNNKPFKQAAKVPTLEEVCEWANHKEVPIRLFIEIKGAHAIHPNDVEYGKFDDVGHSPAEIAQKVYQVVKQSHRHHFDYFISFEHIYVEEVRKLDAEAHIGFSEYSPLRTEGLIEKALKYQAEGIMLHQILITEKFVEEAKANNLKVWTYTLITKEQLERAKVMGVDAGCINDFNLR